MSYCLSWIDYTVDCTWIHVDILIPCEDKHNRLYSPHIKSIWKNNKIRIPRSGFAKSAIGEPSNGYT